MAQRFNVGDKVMYGGYVYNSGRSFPEVGEIESLVGKTMYNVKDKSGHITRLTQGSVRRIPEDIYNVWIKNNGFA